MLTLIYISSGLLQEIENDARAENQKLQFHITVYFVVVN